MSPAYRAIGFHVFVSRVISVGLAGILAACSDGGDTALDNELLPFQSYPLQADATGGTCANSVDLEAPLITSGHGFNPANTRHSESLIDQSTLDGLVLDFTYASDGVSEMRGAPAVTAQSIFFTAGDALIAINRKSGCRYWQFDHPDGGLSFRSTSVLLAVDAPGGAAIFTADNAGNVFAVDAASGELRWREFAGTSVNDHFITGGMQFIENTLIVPVSSKEVVSGAFKSGGCCTSHGLLVALDASSGERRWEYHTTAEATTVILPGERMGPNGAPVWATPTVDAERRAIYIGTGQNYTEPVTDTSDAIISVDFDSGGVNWIYQATSGDAWNYACQFNVILRCPDPEGHDFDFGASPILSADGSTLYAGDKGGMVYAIDADSGELIWARRVSRGSMLGGVHWGMALDNARLYVAATDFEIDPASGALQDLTPGANPGLFALDPATGDVLWEVDTQRSFEGLDTPVLFSASLAVTNDVVFAGSLDGMMMAFAADSGAALWSFDVSQALPDVNGVAGDGGSIDGAGFVIAGDSVIVNSGYSEIFGGVGRYQAGSGNTLYVFSIDP